MHNWSLQTFTKGYDLASHTTYTYILVTTLSDRFLRNFSWKIYLLYSHNILPEIWCEVVAEEIFFSHFFLLKMSDLWFEPRPHF